MIRESGKSSGTMQGCADALWQPLGFVYFLASLPWSTLRLGLSQLWARGPWQVWRHARHIYWWHSVVQRHQYQRWCREMEPQSQQNWLMLETAQHDEPRRFSIIMPTYNPPLHWLKAAIDSVQQQTYSHWELCLADDCSTDPAVRPFLEHMAQTDSRIRVTFRDQNGHISAASNSAIALATGEFLVLLDQDDLLSPVALAAVAAELRRHPAAQLLYSDEDKLDEQGQRFGPYFKPDWNWGQMLSHNMCSHLGVYQTELVRRLGGFRVGLEGSQDYDLALRCAESLAPAQIRHIPLVLYHWRVSASSTALNPAAKNYAFIAGQRAIQEFLQRNQFSGEVFQGAWPGLYRIRWNRRAALENLLVISWGPADRAPPEDGFVAPDSSQSANIGWQRLTLTDPATVTSAAARDRELLTRLQTILQTHPADFIVLLHATVSPPSHESLMDLLATAQQPLVGAVGAKLLAGERVYHSGAIRLASGEWRTLGRNFPAHLPGPYGWIWSLRDCGSVSPFACLCRRDLLLAAIEIALKSAEPVDWNSSLSAAATQLQLRIWWTPEVVMNIDPTTIGDEDVSAPTRCESADNSAAKTSVIMSAATASTATAPVYYSRNHDQSGADFNLAFAPISAEKMLAAPSQHSPVLNALRQGAS